RRGEGCPTAPRQCVYRGWSGTNPGPVGRGGKHVPDTVTTTTRLPHRTVWEPRRVGGTSGRLVCDRSCPCADLPADGPMLPELSFVERFLHRSNGLGAEVPVVVDADVLLPLADRDRAEVPVVIYAELTL